MGPPGLTGVEGIGDKGCSGNTKSAVAPLRTKGIICKAGRSRQGTTKLNGRGRDRVICVSCCDT
jgi:hypothetical protein